MPPAASKPVQASSSPAGRYDIGLVQLGPHLLIVGGRSPAGYPPPDQAIVTLDLSIPSTSYDHLNWSIVPERGASSLESAVVLRIANNPDFIINGGTSADNNASPPAFLVSIDESNPHHLLASWTAGASADRGPPVRRRGAAAVSTENASFMFGGADASAFVHGQYLDGIPSATIPVFNDVWSLDYHTMLWSQVTQDTASNSTTSHGKDVPLARYWATATPISPFSFVVLGGLVTASNSTSANITATVQEHTILVGKKNSGMMSTRFRNFGATARVCSPGVSRCVEDPSLGKRGEFHGFSGGSDVC